MTSEQKQRSIDRATRLKRDSARRDRQRVALVIALIAVAVLGTAFALRPAAAPPTPVSARGKSPAPSEPTRTVEASAAAETTRAAAKPAGAAVPKRLVPAPGAKTIVVDKSEQRVTLYKADGRPVDTFRCASGVVYPRVGDYKVFGHDPQSWGLSDDTTFYYFTKFAKSDKGNNIGFHSIPQNPDGSVVGKLGVAVSHGCVRLDKAKARFVFTWAVAGTKVVVRR